MVLMSHSGWLKSLASREVRVRHAGEGRHPGLWFEHGRVWIPACAGMSAPMKAENFKIDVALIVQLRFSDVGQ